MHTVFNNTKPTPIEDLCKDISEKRVLLPEFQRNFIWSIEQTVDLFDSLARNIFIGAFIFAKPKFPLSCRELDSRPRKGKGARAKIEVKHIAKNKFENDNLYVVLDGQQRITSLYRTLKGVDVIYFVFKKPEDMIKEGREITSLEQLIDGFSSKIIDDRFCVPVDNIFESFSAGYREKKIRNEIFDVHADQYSAFLNNSDLRERYFDILLEIRSLFQKIITDKTLLSVFILDMDLEKFCMFFERSNSKGITLNFLDIITAKIYKGFNLRKKREEFEEQNKDIAFDDPIVEAFVRYISFLKKGAVDKKTILTYLDDNDFNNRWEIITKMYIKVRNFLLSEKILYDINNLPYKTMYIPMMHFVYNLPNRDFSQRSHKQDELFKFWFWGSLLNTRYGGGMVGSTNDIIVEDCNTLASLAKTGKIENDFLRKFKFSFDFDDLLETSSKGAIFIGIMSLMNYKKNLRDWVNGGNINFLEKYDIHHIFPVKYIEENYFEDSFERVNLDSILNKAIIGKITNIKFGKKSPSIYLNEKPISDNNKLIESLETHLIPIPKELIKGEYDSRFKEFLQERFSLIKTLMEETLDKTKDKYTTIV